MLTYSQRSAICHNPTAQKLLTIIENKKTNLCVAADLTHSAELLALADLIGPSICVLKTHIDILEDFSPDIIEQLKKVAEKHQILIFEDRKFADIGNTVKLQYEKGIYHIADWADITTAHSVSGSGVIEGLKTIGLAKGNGLLLLAQMSSTGSLITGDYTKKTIALAEAHKDFVIGFITQQKLTDDPALLHFTPGVQFNNKMDALGQQYISPKQAIIQGSDIIIVGRGIYGAIDPKSEAEKYRVAGWKAYQMAPYRSR